MNICLFGGAFDPIHISHVLAIHYLSAVGNFDKIFVCPTYSSPAGKKLIDFKHRLKMCNIALNFLPNVIVSSIEQTLPEPSYTINTINKLKQFYPKDNLRIAIGADILSNQHLWDPEHLKKIFELAPPFILGRFGYEYPEAEGPIIEGISSTKVRELIKTDNHTELSKMVPNSVLKYISENKLYI